MVFLVNNFSKNRTKLQLFFDMCKFIAINLTKNVNFFCCAGQSGI